MKSEHVLISGRRIALTSVLSWTQLQFSGKTVHEKLQVIGLLKTFPEMTSRQIAEKTSIERTSVTRCLRQLEDDSIVKVSQIKSCPTTGKMVRWYALMSNVDSAATLKLFD